MGMKGGTLMLSMALLITNLLAVQKRNRLAYFACYLLSIIDIRIEALLTSTSCMCGAPTKLKPGPAGG